jgi:curved DNA-binding protein CbpA
VRRDFEDLDGADPWAVLGVRRDAGAEDVKRAYRRLVTMHHPDARTGDEQRFKQVGLAYAIVSEPDRARAYADRLRRAAEPDPPPVPPVAEEPSVVEDEAEEQPPFSDRFDWQEGAGPAPTPARAAPTDEYEYEYEYEPPPVRRRPRPDSLPPPPGWNRLAIVSLVLVFVCFPVSVWTGCTALAQIRSTKERGAAVAWTAIVLSVAPILLVCAARLFTGPA